MSPTPHESETPAPKSTFYRWCFCIGLVWCVSSWLFRSVSSRHLYEFSFPWDILFLGELGLVLSFFSGMAIAGTGFGKSDFLRNEKYGVLRVALYTGLGIHALVILVSLPFFGLEYGSEIRPMGYSVLLFGLEGCGILFCLIPALISLSTTSQSFACFACGLLGISPLFTGVMTLGLAIKVRGLEMLH